ncbi:MAG: hypothetical protein K2Y37_11010 [Pirellulales bacterium]|nr:hypothetical protein [Pirellulales bacterium]
MFAMVAGSGCSKVAPRIETYPTEGKIVFQGKPPVGANLVLHPVGEDAAKLPRPQAVVEKDGTFKLTTYEKQDGAPVGKYKVSIYWYKPTTKNGEVDLGKNLLPEVYADPAKSGLEVEVTASAINQLKPMTLKR